MQFVSYDSRHDEITVLFPLTYFVLDCISELYGFRRARQVLVYCSSLLMLIGGFCWVQAELLDKLVHGDHTHIEQQAAAFVFRDLPEDFFKLGLSLLLTDTINIFLFHRLRSWMNNRWFAVRSAVSTTVALGLFSLVASVTRYQDYWNDPETLHFVIDITLMKLALVPLYLPIGVGILLGARYWQKRYAQ